MYIEASLSHESFSCMNLPNIDKIKIFDSRIINNNDRKKIIQKPLSL